MTGSCFCSVASSAGYLAQLSSTQQRSLTNPQLTQDDLEASANAFVASITAGQHTQEGWSNSMYGVSKLLEIASTRVQADLEGPHGVALYS